MIKKYELIENGTCNPHNSFSKCREGLDQAYQRAEQVIADDSTDHELWQLEIHCTTYDACGKVISSELVDEWEVEEGYRDCVDESMDGDFDSAMASAGFGTDEDYGCFGDETYGADF